MKAKKPTKVAKVDIGISDKDRAAIAHGLSGLLADSYTLYLTTHNFHWNVTGPMFNTLHLMFMTQYTEQWTALDLIAERIRALGHPAPGTYKEFVKLASIKEVEGVPKGDGHGASLDRRTGSHRTYRAQTLSIDQPCQRSTHRRLVDPAYRGPRENGVDATQLVGRMIASRLS